MDEQALTPAEDQEIQQEELAEAEPEKPSKDLLDKTWDFFASVPIATVLIFIIAAASVAGSLIEQEGVYSDWRPPADFYPARYGPKLGLFLFKTGMTRMYTSWWFMGLLYMLGASLVICSLERFVPLWRAVQRPNITPPESFVKHLRNRFTYSGSLADLAAALKARRYGVVVEGDRLYADKGRWGRWGPYITHIGLILILAGAMMRAIPGFYSDQFVWVRDGSIVRVPGTDWYVKNDKFTLETYDNGMPKAYITDATVIEDGKEVKQHRISMNQPLQHKWVELYQTSYKQEFGKVEVAALDRKTNTQLGNFSLDLVQPEASYNVGGTVIRLKDYFPDFGLDDKGKPVSRSSEIQNPGFLFEVTPKDGKPYSVWFFALYPEMEFDPTTPIRFNTTNVVETATTGLKVKKDLGIPVIYAGLIVVSLGVCFTFYLAHRRYWAIVSGGKVIVGGWTNRNLTSLQSEMSTLATTLDPAAHPNKESTEGEER